jgi:hypothetical protein
MAYDSEVAIRPADELDERRCEQGRRSARPADRPVCAKRDRNWRRLGTDREDLVGSVRVNVDEPILHEAHEISEKGV